ncbi:MAG: transposase [Moheibacter sp.]
MFYTLALNLYVLAFHSDLCTPMQNGFCERFNKTFREDVLDAYWFENIEQARTIAQDWMDDYNNHHPHSSLADCSPIEFKLKRSA